MTAVIHGLRELQAAAAQTERDTRLFITAELRHAAEPVQRTAEGLAMDKIRRMQASPQWAQMRIGVTRSVVYVAPKQAGVKRKGNPQRRRPNLADLLMGRAMEPALEQNEAVVESAVEAALDRSTTAFNTGGA